MSDPKPTPKGTEALVSFTTKLPSKYQVPEDELVVPSSLARYGLSEVVNRLLESDPPQPFDFLVDGEFLRTTVLQYLESRKLSTEKVLKLEFVLALSDPETSKVDKAPDWIASVCPLGKLPTPWFAAVGYDGSVRVFEENQSRLVTQLASCPLTAVTAMATEVSGGDGSLLVAAGKDGRARCCALSRGKAGARLGDASTLRAPPAAETAAAHAAQSVAISEDGTLLASSGWDNDILIWNTESALFADPPSNGSSSTPGKRKASTDAGEGKLPKFTLSGHTQVVTALHFGAKGQFPYALISGSWDSTVRVWDTVAASCVCNWTVARAVTSLTVNPESPPQMATSHEDGHVSIWDIRAAPHLSIKGAFSLDVTTGLPLSSAQVPHNRMATQVAWCPMDANRLASVGHDGKFNILDPRSPKMPLQTMSLGAKGVNPTKLLCVCWLGSDTLAVGGSDGRVVRISLNKTRE